MKKLKQTNEIGKVQFEASTLMQLLGLGKVEKGSSDMKSKYKSLTERWYNQVSTKKKEAINKHDSDLVLQRDSIVNLQLKRGGTVEVASYRVFSLFTMYNKKWFVSEEDEFAWMNGSTGNGKGRVLARLLRVSGLMKRDVKLEKD